MSPMEQNFWKDMIWYLERSGDLPRRQDPAKRPHIAPVPNTAFLRAWPTAYTRLCYKIVLPTRAPYDTSYMIGYVFSRS